MSRELRAVNEATILRIEGQSFVDYGPSEHTRLTITAVDAQGGRNVIVFESEAIRQLAKVFGEIVDVLPSAVYGN